MKTTKTDRPVAQQQSLSPKKGPSRLMVILGLSAMIGLAITLSVTVFLDNSLRLDEAQSLFQSSRTPSGVLKLVAEDVHVPFYHIVLHFWLKIFGGTIAAARVLSLVFFVLIIPATYLLGRYAYHSRSIGLFGAFLVATSPFMNWYGSEARMYTMLAFFTIINQLFFLKIFRKGQPSAWLGYGLTAILGMYTHYFFTFVLLTQVLFYVYKRREFYDHGRRSFRNFLTTGMVVAAAFLPWVIYVLRLGFASNTRPNLSPPTSIDLFNTYSQFIFGFQVDYLNTIIVSLWPAVVLLAFFALQKNRKTTPETIFLVLAAVVPVVGAFFLSLAIQPFYLSRYLIVSLPPLLLFIGWTFSSYPPQLARALKAALVVGVVAAFAVQVISPDTPVKEDYAAATSYLAANADSQDVIVVSAPFTIYPIEYYYEGGAKLTTLPQWDRFSQGAIPAFSESNLPEEVKAVNRSYQRAWLVLSFNQGYENTIKDYYDNNFEQLEERDFSPGLTVYSYKLRYDDPINIDLTTNR